MSEEAKAQEKGIYEDYGLGPVVEEEVKEEKAAVEEKPTKEVEESTVEEDDEVPGYEEEARKEGWRPKDEWDGDPDDWVDAKEFNFRGKLMKRIQQQSSELSKIQKENQEVKDALRALGEHNKKIAEKEYERAIKDLQNRRLEAMEEGEHRTVLEVEEQIDDLKKSKDELEQENKADTSDTDEGQSELPEAVKEWLGSDSNKWYHEDPIMRAAADTVYINYLQDNPSDFAGALDYVEKTIQKRFPNEMGVQKRTTKSAVTETDGRSNANKRQGTKKRFTPKDLTDEQRGVAQTFVSQGVFKNVQEYVDQLVDTGELG